MIYSAIAWSFKRCLKTWRNLAIVHERLATTSSDPQIASENFEMAQKAGNEFERIKQNASSMQPQVQWLTPEQFEQTAPAEFNEIRSARALPEPMAVPETNNKPSMLQRFKDLF